MKLYILAIMIIISAQFTSGIDSGHTDQNQANYTPKPNEAAFEVHGIVCSFCSFGLQRNLSKLTFVDHSRYNKGVHVEIKTQMVILAIKPDTNIDIKLAYKAIKTGGYDPKRATVVDASGLITHFTKDGEQCTTCD